VVRITAEVETPDGIISAEPYTSAGTTYSQFAVIQMDTHSFEVTRRVTAGDEKPLDYVEPTEKQK
jgi:hypothetical protein